MWIHYNVRTHAEIIEGHILLKTYLRLRQQGDAPKSFVRAIKSKKFFQVAENYQKKIPVAQSNRKPLSDHVCY